MTKFSILGMAAFATAVLFGQAQAQTLQPMAAGHVQRIDLKATDDEAGPAWDDTPSYTSAQVAAAAGNGETDLNAFDPENNITSSPGTFSHQVAVIPAKDGDTDLNPFDNAS